MDVIVVIDVGARRQHGVELLAGRALHVAQKALLFRHALPAVLHRDAPAVGEREGGDVERVAEGVLGNMRARIAVHAAAGIGGDLLDLDHARAEPALRRRLHGIGEPAIQRRDDRTGQRRRRLHRDRTDRVDGIALRRSEPRQGCAPALRIGRAANKARNSARAADRPARSRTGRLPRRALGRQIDFVFLRGDAGRRSAKSVHWTARA